jgi:hypothetical protein
VDNDAELEPNVELRGFADEHGVSLAVARSFLDEQQALAGAERFYIFWTGGSGGGAGSAGRQRTLLAFRTPDAALGFAQRNRLGQAGERPRLRRLSMLQLIQAMLREPSIGTLVIVDEGEDQLAPAGQLPLGARIERADLVRRLHESI